ncbi:MAG TPA: hypothetical protein VFP91_16495, partial [Vicinamibacterales bacterium]|nr:hypothetical protein [Vicinamibacterales bacterium]
MRNRTTILSLLAASVLFVGGPAYAAAPECGTRTVPAISSDDSPLEIKVVTASKFAESISDA